MTDNQRAALPAEFVQLLDGLAEERRQRAAQPTAGQRFAVPRQGKEAVEVLLYRPKNAAEKPLPVLFNLHGGAWIFGDAVLMESFCALLAEEIPALVVNVNYKKADVHPLPYAQQELCDTVRYFAVHAQEYGIDPARMAVGGHSAGAHLAAGAAMMLHRDGVALAGQMLVYPAADLQDSGFDQLRGILFADGGSDSFWASPVRAPQNLLTGLAPALVIVCGRDTLRPQGLAYAERLQQAGVPVTLKEYPAAEHGFLEVNRPDYPADARQQPGQAAMARDAEAWLTENLRRLFAQTA